MPIDAVSFSTPTLPSPLPMARPQFSWGDVDCTISHSRILRNSTLEEKIFSVPSGKAGKAFVSELAGLYRAYAEGSALEVIALKATTIMPILLLQKPHKSSKSREHVICLFFFERRLMTWKTGDIEGILHEGRTIQQRLPKYGSILRDEDHTALTFAKLMFQGKTRAALRLITEQCKGGVLRLDSTIPSSNPDSEPLSVREILMSKHPASQPASAESIYNGGVDPPVVHPVLFECIDAAMIRNVALRTEGAAGPSCIDSPLMTCAYLWLY